MSGSEVKTLLIGTSVQTAYQGLNFSLSQPDIPWHPGFHFYAFSSIQALRLMQMPILCGAVGGERVAMNAEQAAAVSNCSINGMCEDACQSTGGAVCDAQAGRTVTLIAADYQTVGDWTCSET